MRTFRLVLISSLLAAIPARLAAQAPDTSFVRTNYIKREYRLAMRDGADLFTIVYLPKDASPSNTYPIVMQRTPFSVAPYGPDAYATMIGPDQFMMREKYIFVYQDVRGRYASEGTFENVRPLQPDLVKARDRTVTDEASDAWDTIDWLVKNVPGNNGRVGLWGISYPGHFALMGAISGHPAVVAVSPQAPVTDLYFEDFHHNGALTQGYFYAYPVFGVPRPQLTTKHWWLPKMIGEGLPDDYHFQLALGPLSTTTSKYYKDNLLWQQIIQHPDYDAFWQARAVVPHLTGSMPAMLSVGGWFDAEDLSGPLAVYKQVQSQNPAAYNGLVEGPWGHGVWGRQAPEHSLHGDIYFGDSLEIKYQRDVEAKFFRHYLKESGQGSPPTPKALIFDTGRKTWDSFPDWPPPTAAKRQLYFQANGKLGPDPSKGLRTYDEYLSDPALPVPSRCSIPTMADLSLYMSDDQRCFENRRDVLTYATDSLTADVTLAGEITARLYVSTTGTDADFVVKLIDVYPMGEPDSPWRPDTTVHYAGYQQLVRGEIMRGRYRNGFERPQAFVPNEVTEVRFRLQDVLHTFKKGHRIMVQVQSSWFPMFDRNPQTFVPNIYEAKAGDFVKATVRLYHTGQRGSGLEVGTLNR